MASRLAREVTEVFSPGGPLSRSLPGFEPRPGQLRLASAWAEAIAGGRVLVAEAATGIGKTLAYLVPVVLSGHKAVISTGTKTLQQQIVEKDVPLVRSVLRRPFSCAVIKGRSNYLCLRRWKRFAAAPSFEFAAEAGLFERMRDFAGTTLTGDVSEASGVPEDLRAWADVNARAETCDAASCGETDRCFLAAARRRAAQADIVVANHHLFFADLALKGKAQAGRRGPIEVLPAADVAVLDEAQSIEETASSFFGVTVSLARAEELARDVRRAAPSPGGRAVLPAAEAFRRAAEGFFSSLPAGSGRLPVPPPGEDALLDLREGDLRRSIEELVLALESGPAEGSAGMRTAPEGEAFARRARAFLEDIGAVRTADGSDAVAWGERRGRSATLGATPVDVAPILSGALWGTTPAVLLASATLSVRGDLSYFRERVGLGAVDAGEIIVDNEFDFGGRALAYVPEGLPDPGEDGFAESAAAEAGRILSLSGGGALLLCTTSRAVAAFADALRESSPHAVLVQGEAPRPELLRAFREGANAVLIGTGTFWEGIDVPGDALRCVVIDKLPFAPPGDPVVAARIRSVRERGGDPFNAYQLPEAVLAFRQGVGRLLRRGDDYGVIAILDRRIMTRPYGAAFRGSVPALPWTRDPSRVARFFRTFRPSRAPAGASGGKPAVPEGQEEET